MRDAERAMERLGEERARLEGDLARAGSDHVALGTIGAQLESVLAAIADEEQRWLEAAEVLER